MGHRPPGRVGLPPSLLACGSALNIARFCDRGIGRRMEEATNLQLVDPLAAHDLWSSTEHEIVDLALGPLVEPVLGGPRLGGAGQLLVQSPMGTTDRPDVGSLSPSASFGLCQVADSRSTP